MDNPDNVYWCSRVSKSNNYGDVLALKQEQDCHCRKRETVILNKTKIILDLCGGTGAWSKLYKENGYIVLNVTLPEFDVCTYQPPKNVYGILAAPPCTMFSLARKRAKTPRDLQAGMEVVIACLNIIWECRYINKLAFWCLENPTGILRQFLGIPVMTYHPYEYGDPYTKRTDLWGYFGLPKKKKVKMSYEEIEVCQKNSRKLPSISDFTGSTQADRRAITPAGFAKAFYKVNK